MDKGRFAYGWWCNFHIIVEPWASSLTQIVSKWTSMAKYLGQMIWVRWYDADVWHALSLTLYTCFQRNAILGPVFDGTLKNVRPKTADSLWLSCHLVQKLCSNTQTQSPPIAVYLVGLRVLIKSLFFHRTSCGKVSRMSVDGRRSLGESEFTFEKERNMRKT